MRGFHFAASHLGVGCAKTPPTPTHTHAHTLYLGNWVYSFLSGYSLTGLNFPIKGIKRFERLHNWVINLLIMGSQNRDKS